MCDIFANDTYRTLPLQMQYPVYANSVRLEKLAPLSKTLSRKSLRFAGMNAPYSKTAVYYRPWNMHIMNTTASFIISVLVVGSIKYNCIIITPLFWTAHFIAGLPCEESTTQCWTLTIAMHNEKSEEQKTHKITPLYFKPLFHVQMNPSRDKTFIAKYNMKNDSRKFPSISWNDFELLLVWIESWFVSVNLELTYTFPYKKTTQQHHSRNEAESFLRFS